MVGPATTPNVSDIVGDKVDGGKLTESQLNTAMDLGLYSDNKYLLQSMPQDEVDLLLLSKVGGQARLFGGSYDIVGGSSQTESEQGGSTSVETEFEDESNGDVSTAEQKQPGKETPAEVTDRTVNARMIIGSRPLSPITLPVFSPQVKTMLEKGLAPQIEETFERIFQSMKNHPVFGFLFVGGSLLFMLSLNAQNRPSINSLNEKNV